MGGFGERCPSPPHSHRASEPVESLAEVVTASIAVGRLESGQLAGRVWLVDSGQATARQLDPGLALTAPPPIRLLPFISQIEAWPLVF